jgi:hypothetical protein
MSKVVEFLEKLGSEAKWRTASHAELERALAESDIEMPVQQAILAKDTDRLSALVERSHLFATHDIGILIPSAMAGYLIPSQAQALSNQVGFPGELTPSLNLEFKAAERAPFVAMLIPTPNQPA